MKKLESDPAHLSAEGIYRVPGDAAKIQRLRIDIDQVRNLANLPRMTPKDNICSRGAGKGSRAVTMFT